MQKMKILGKNRKRTWKRMSNKDCQNKAKRGRIVGRSKKRERRVRYLLEDGVQTPKPESEDVDDRTFTNFENKMRNFSLYP